MFAFILPLLRNDESNVVADTVLNESLMHSFATYNDNL